MVYLSFIINLYIQYEMTALFYWKVYIIHFFIYKKYI